MENIPTSSSENPNKCKSKETYAQYLLSKASRAIKIEKFDRQNWSDCFV